MAVITWKTDEEIRSAAIARAWASIKAERDRRQQDGGFRVDGYWLHSDTDSRIQQMRLESRGKEILAVGGTESDPIIIGGTPVMWKTMTGEFVPITAGMAINIGVLAEETELQLFAVAEQHRQAMEQSESPESYDYSAGWPVAFWER